MFLMRQVITYNLSVPQSIYCINHCYFCTDMGHNSADYLHHLIEATRLAFVDGLYYIADPTMASVPTQGLLDKGYAASRRALIDPDV